jgi:hypothetical protein
MSETITGFKGFKSNFKAFSSFQYAVGKTYVHEWPPICFCTAGFHFCVHAQDVLNYYPDNKQDEEGGASRYAIIEASGEVKHGIDKSVCSVIKIVKEITIDELRAASTRYIKRQNGNEEWYEYGELHRDGDLPAIVCDNGDMIWFRNGVRHRDGGLPAHIYAGGREWWKNGLIHRGGDLPARICDNGDMGWFKNGLRHRDRDLPAIIWNNGTRVWYRNGTAHRANDLPAAVYANGDMEWVDQEGKVHRDNGLPARICSGGTIQDYYIHGVFQRREKKESGIQI